MLTTRRRFLVGLAGVTAGLLVPPYVAENAEAVRRYWALDRTMVPQEWDAFIYSRLADFDLRSIGVVAHRRGVTAASCTPLDVITFHIDAAHRADPGELLPLIVDEVRYQARRQYARNTVVFNVGNTRILTGDLMLPPTLAENTESARF